MTQPRRKYVQRHYTVRFLAPAFLGNAAQDAQWRTPPFKALLRQWWRVAWMADQGYPRDIATMRHDEGLLFGHAWLEDDALTDQSGNTRKTAGRQSAVRLRLDTLPDGKRPAWQCGTQEGVTPLTTSIANSYAWFGLAKRGKNEPDRTAIQARGDESLRILKLAAPEESITRIDTAIRLIEQFGTLGSRSRGGWGSIALETHGSAPPNVSPEHVSLDWRDCLETDWARGIARCEKGAWVWESRRSFATWDKAMAAVAQERRDARQGLKQPASDLRKALGFAGNGRMPSPLRWKLFKHSDQNLKIRIFAMPHQIPAASGERLSARQLEQAWLKIASLLDQSDTFQRRTGA